MIFYKFIGQVNNMYISHKSNVIQQVHETEWQCRRLSKGLNKSEYWTWIATITDSDGEVTYPSEDFTIVECLDEDVYTRLAQLDDHVQKRDTLVYNIKYFASKRDSEIVDVPAHKDEDDKDVAATYVQSHFIGDDDAKDARLLADVWKRIRAERDSLIAETDWMMLSDTGTVSAAWKNYRKALREIPQSQDSAKTFEDIDWPDKPSS